MDEVTCPGFALVIQGGGKGVTQIDHKLITPRWMVDMGRERFSVLLFQFLHILKISHNEKSRNRKATYNNKNFRTKSSINPFGAMNNPLAVWLSPIDLVS